MDTKASGEKFEEAIMNDMKKSEIAQHGTSVYSSTEKGCAHGASGLRLKDGND